MISNKTFSQFSRQLKKVASIAKHFNYVGCESFDEHIRIEFYHKTESFAMFIELSNLCGLDPESAGLFVYVYFEEQAQ